MHLNLQPFERQFTYYKNGKVKLPKKPKKWHDSPHTAIIQVTQGEYQPIVLTRFNPGSRAHIRRWLTDYYGWVPEVYTPKGNARVDAEVLKSLPYDEADPLKRYLKLVKDYSQLDGTDNSLIAKFNPETQAIHGRCDALATVTRRAAHSSPNLGQVPKKDPSKGQDGRFRKLFTVPDGWTFVGADASALELKILAHYLYPFDGGEYDTAIDQGDKSNGTDVHSRAQKAMGLPTRDEAKTATYAILYGASGARVGYSLLKEKLDFVVEYTATEYLEAKEKLDRRSELINGIPYFPIAKDMLIPVTERLIEMTIYGDRVVNGFKANLNGYSQMIGAMNDRIITRDGTEYIEAVDTGLLQVRSRHSLANLLFQSAGSIAVKQWMVNFHLDAKAEGLVHGRDFIQMAYIHDELDSRALNHLAKEVGEIKSNAMKRVPEQLGLNVKLEAEYMLGDSWFSCH